MNSDKEEAHSLREIEMEVLEEGREWTRRRLGFATAYSTRSQSSNVRWVCCWREAISFRRRKVGTLA